MAYARESNRENNRENILKVLMKISGENLTGSERPILHPSSAGTTLGPDVSLIRNVAVPPIIVFNCLLLF